MEDYKATLTQELFFEEVEQAVFKVIQKNNKQYQAGFEAGFAKAKQEIKDDYQAGWDDGFQKGRQLVLENCKDILERY